MIQLTENIIAIEVPKDAITFEIRVGNGDRWFVAKHHSGQRGSLTLLGECTPLLIDITPLSEKQAIQIVKTSFIPQFGSMFINYTRKSVYCGTAHVSFNSLLESKGLEKYAIVKMEK